LVGSSGPVSRALSGIGCGEPRIDARTPQVEELLDPHPVRSVDHVRVDHGVVEEELGRTGPVGVDPTDGSGDDDDLVRPRLHHEVPDAGLHAQIELLVRVGDDGRPAPPLELAHDGRAPQAGVAGHIDALAICHPTDVPTALIELVRGILESRSGGAGRRQPHRPPVRCSMGSVVAASPVSMDRPLGEGRPSARASRSSRRGRVGVTTGRHAGACAPSSSPKTAWATSSPN